MMESKPLCSIVIVSYNGKKLLAKFLPSIKRNVKYPKYEVIIVDNGSIDGTSKYLKENFPTYQIVRVEKNVGVAEGNNIGGCAAQGKYIFWMSNDMELEPYALEYMIERMESDPEIGICTCKKKKIIEGNRKTNILDSVGIDLDLFGFPAVRGINQEDKGQLDYFTEIFCSFGGELLIRKKIFEQVRGFDGKTFILGDDLDFSWRVRLLGYKIVVEPRAVIYHRRYSTLGTIFDRGQKRFYSEKNTLRMLLKNYSLTCLLICLPFYFLIYSGTTMFFFLLGKFSLVGSEIQALVWNIKNFPDTLRERRIVQNRRVISDQKITKLMAKKSHVVKIFIDYLKNRHAAHWKGYFGEVKKR